MKSLFKKIIPPLLVQWYHQFWPLLGALLYRFPSRKIKVIGVTGTNGKTTVTHLATEILEEARYKVASISSLRFKVGQNEWKNELKMTMPGRMKVQKFLRQAADAGCQYAVMEVTSEGITQHRHRFIDFDTAVFTNLTPEHIESHGSFENYKKAKGELFKRAKTAIVNLDDENAEFFLSFPSFKKYTYSIRREQTTTPYEKFGSYPSTLQAISGQAGSGLRLRDSDSRRSRAKSRDKLQVTSYETSKNGTTFTINNSTKFNLPLLGKFNIYNALAAICVGLSQRVDMQVAKHALEKTRGVPGRMEIVAREPFSVIVDYAHTPDALEKVYKTIGGGRWEVGGGRTICVLGSAGGGRDKWKRPEMGKLAAKYCDQIILTDEDPYDEPPEKILEDIEKGVTSYELLRPSEASRKGGPVTRYSRILDRRDAIKKALQIAQHGDTVIITGKGAEPWLMTKQGKIPWDDREVVREEIHNFRLSR